MPEETTPDNELDAVVADLGSRDPQGKRTGVVLRESFDQIYDGLRTGRYRWDDPRIHKTERTHFGTIVEINLHRTFQFEDGVVLDYRIAGVDVDCKYSQTMYGWMVPPEAVGQLCLLMWADDLSSRWSMGVVRASENILRSRPNRDAKTQIKMEGRSAIRWIFQNEPLPPNVLLQLPQPEVERIMALRHGTKRVNELFRVALGKRVGRNAVATVARQWDYMKRVRTNGGARSALRPEGIIILGQGLAHGSIAQALGVDSPGPGEFVSIRVTPAEAAGSGVAQIDGGYWRAATPGEPAVNAPLLPKSPGPSVSYSSI